MTLVICQHAGRWIGAGMARVAASPRFARFCPWYATGIYGLTSHNAVPEGRRLWGQVELGDTSWVRFRMPKMTREPAIAFANQLRSARLAALGDAEAFDGIIHVVERIGSYLSKERLGDLGKVGSLYNYGKELLDLASNSGVAIETPEQFSVLLTPFGRLYDLVTVARNDALHQGAFARHLTGHVIELAIILEDALSNHLDPASLSRMLCPAATSQCSCRLRLGEIRRDKKGGAGNP